MIQNVVDRFVSGTQNLLPQEIIAQDAASDSLNWITRDGVIQLSNGRQVQGAAGAAGQSYGEHTGFRVDGTSVRFRKVNGTIQALVAGTWTNVITGLTNTADYVFANYASLAGAFVYVFGPDGIYKIPTASPTSYVSLYDPTKNFKGYGIIDKGRTLLWGRAEDPTGLYGSNIDAQNGTVYTSVAAEAIGASGSSAYSGNLASRTADQMWTPFGLSIYGRVGASKAVTLVTQQADGAVEATAHGFVAGDKVMFAGVGGMTQLNSGVFTVSSVTSADAFRLTADTTSYGAYTSGGTVAKAEVFADDFNGALKSNLGSTGTINYATAAYAVTFSVATTGAVVADYQYENSNVKGVTDFTHSATRIAGEGFVVRQDAGGDAIQVVIPLDGSYFSLKKHSCYKFTLDATDLAPTNDIYRTDIGVPSLRAATATGEGIMFMNTANPSKPHLWLLKQNPIGDTFDVSPLFPQYDFSPFTYEDCLLDFWDRYVVVGCRYQSAANNRLLLCDLQAGSVDATYYGIRASTKDGGLLYGGDSVSQSTYELFTGFDDLGNPLQNYWLSKAESYGPGQTKANRYKLGQHLKKFRYARVQGSISPDQAVEVYLSTDQGDYQLVGTILGSGDYVDYNSTFAVGTTLVGTAVVGGGATTGVNNFFMQIKVKVPKFRVRNVKFVATKIGYVSIGSIIDHDIFLYEDRLPSKYRSKQNVSLDGAMTDMGHPQF